MTVLLLWSMAFTPPAPRCIVREIMDVHLQATERLARVTAKRA